MRKDTQGANTSDIRLAASHAAARRLRPRRTIAALLAAIAVLVAAFATAAVQDGSGGFIGGGTQVSAGAATEQPRDDADRDVAVLQQAFGLGASILGATWS